MSDKYQRVVRIVVISSVVVILTFAEIQTSCRRIRRTVIVLPKHVVAFILTYRRNGYNESFSSKNLNIAKEKFKRFIFDLKKQPRQGSKKNFAEIAEIYLYKVKKPLLHEDSFKNNLVTYRNHILNHFGGKPIDKITPLDIQNVVNDLYEQGKTRTIEEVSTLLRGIFSFAISNKYLTRYVSL